MVITYDTCMKICNYKEFKHPNLKTFLFQAARVITEKDFMKALSEIKGIHPQVVDWLLDHAD